MFPFKKGHFRGSGRRCFVLGNGPSLMSYDLDAVPDKFLIGCNLVVHSGIIPDVLCVSDPHMLEDNLAGIVNGKMSNGHYVVRSKLLPASEKALSSLSNVIRVEPDRSHPWIDPELKRFRVTNNGVVCDLSIPTAVYLGFEEIYLIGVEGRHGTKSHFYDYAGESTPGYLPSKIKDNVYRENSYADIMAQASAMGIRIFNCHPDADVTPEVPKARFADLVMPKRILIAGQSRSGSTLLLNIIRAIYRRHNPSVSFAPPFGPGFHVCKVHQYNKALHEQADIVFTCRRDIRDSIASGYLAIKEPWNSNYRRNLSINHIGDGILREYKDWEGKGDYEFVYERYVENTHAVLEEIKALLGSSMSCENIKTNIEKPLSLEQCATASDNDRKIKGQSSNGGKIGGFRKIFSKEEIEKLNGRYSEFLTGLGYKI